MTRFPRKVKTYSGRAKTSMGTGQKSSMGRYEIEYEPGKWRPIGNKRVEKVSGHSWYTLRAMFESGEEVTADLLNGERLRFNPDFNWKTGKDFTGMNPS